MNRVELPGRVPRVAGHVDLGRRQLSPAQHLHQRQGLETSPSMVAGRSRSETVRADVLGLEVVGVLGGALHPPVHGGRRPRPAVVLVEEPLHMQPDTGIEPEVHVPRCCRRLRGPLVGERLLKRHLVVVLGALLGQLATGPAGPVALSLTVAVFLEWDGDLLLAPVDPLFGHVGQLAASETETSQDQDDERRLVAVVVIHPAGALEEKFELSVVERVFFAVPHRVLGGHD